MNPPRSTTHSILLNVWRSSRFDVKLNECERLDNQKCRAILHRWCPTIDEGYSSDHMVCWGYHLKFYTTGGSITHPWVFQWTRLMRIIVHKRVTTSTHPGQGMSINGYHWLTLFAVWTSHQYSLFARHESSRTFSLNVKCETTPTLCELMYKWNNGDTDTQFWMYGRM